MRWLIVLPFARPGLMGMDFGAELRELGHEVRLFAYRRDNPLYKNTPTKAAYQLWILRRLERVCLRYRPRRGARDQGRVDHARPRAPDQGRLDVLFVNFFPDNPLWMIPFECIEAYDVFFTKERYALRQPAGRRPRNLHYLPMYCVPSLHHPVTPTPAEAERFGAPLSLVGSRYAYRERLVRELADYPLRVWGSGWRTWRMPGLRVAGGRARVRARQALRVRGLDRVAESPTIQ